MIVEVHARANKQVEPLGLEQCVYAVLSLLINAGPLIQPSCVRFKCFYILVAQLMRSSGSLITDTILKRSNGNSN